MDITLSKDRYEAIVSYARSNMLNLIATGSPPSSVFRGQERTGIKLTDNPAHFCLYVTGKDEKFLYSIGKDKHDNVEIFNRICAGLKDLENARDYRLEPFYHNVTKQPIILINVPAGDDESIRKKLFLDINEVVNNAYRVQLGEIFANNKIISAVTEDFRNFGIKVRESFDLAVKYVNEYCFFLKEHQVIDNKIMRLEKEKLDERFIMMQVSILKEAINNYKLDNIEAILDILFIEKLKPTFLMEKCIYTIDLLNKMIHSYEDILNLSFNKLNLDDFLFIEDLKDEAVNIFERISLELHNKSLKRSHEINKVKQFIEVNFYKELTIEDIADYIGYNKNYLCKKFKNEMGMTINQYRNLIRITNAKKLLIKTDKSIEDVAFNSGFKNIAYFRTFFKENTGLTPSVFREYYSSKKDHYELYKLDFGNNA